MKMCLKIQFFNTQAFVLELNPILTGRLTTKITPIADMKIGRSTAETEIGQEMTKKWTGETETGTGRGRRRD